MALQVKGKTALVTGGGSGICFAFTKQLLEKGCNVLIADLGLRPEAQQLVDESKDKAPRAVFEKTDVTIWGNLERAIATAVTEFGAIDIFCPGAGVFEPKWSNFWYPPGCPESVDKPSSDGYKTLDINLTHPIRLTQLAISHLLSRKATGSIVHISSIAAQRPNPIDPIYAVSKAGVSALIRSFAYLEPKLGIRVTGVAPGLIKTPLFMDNPDKLSYVDLDKDIWATPEEVAEAMMKLVEEEDMVGGTILEIGANVTRKVELLNDPGPNKEEGMMASNAGLKLEEVFVTLQKEGWGLVPQA